MSEPKTWEALQVLAAALADIRIAGGYHTDAGRRVLTEVFQLGEADTFPTLRIVEDDLEETQNAVDGSVDAINVTIEGYVEHAETDAQIKAHQLRADVLAALKKIRKPRALPAPLLGLELVTRRILQRPEGFPYVVCQVVCRVRLVNH